MFYSFIKPPFVKPNWHKAVWSQTGCVQTTFLNLIIILNTNTYFITYLIPQNVTDITEYAERLNMLFLLYSLTLRVNIIHYITLFLLLFTNVSVVKGEHHDDPVVCGSRAADHDPHQGSPRGHIWTDYDFTSSNHNQIICAVNTHDVSSSSVRYELSKCFILVKIKTQISESEWWSSLNCDRSWYNASSGSQERWNSR